LIKLLSILNKR